MIARHAVSIAAVLLLAACQSHQPSAAQATTYACNDGRQVQAAYPDAESAVLTLDGKTDHLHRAISADGARYVGDGWQWWTKGMEQGMLAPLKPGESVASASGASCRAVTPPR
jgi:membrane-bound inhibitor of C-type lysozyme